MKVVILAGGRGTRLAEETSVRPKPMVEIGGYPILWHIMNIYACRGFKEFVLALGYKGDVIRRYFLDYAALRSNISVDLRTGRTSVDRASASEPWLVHLVETGDRTNTGGRLWLLREWVGSETFFLTYGDGVSNIDLDVLLAFHRAHGKLATVTAVRPPARFGSLELDGDRVTGFAEKLQRHLGDAADEDTRHYSEVVVNSSRRMSALIEDLLTYSRLGRHAMRLRGVDMQSTVEEVRIALTSNIEDRNITWRIAPLPVVIADENMIRLVWQNLLDNAMKYTSSREEAVIEVGIGEPTPLEFTFYVKDNGVGFDMAYADKLFGVFQRLHKASQFAGTGIGLASVRRIVSRHGGRTWAESAPGEGATFFFSLPRSQTQA